MNWESVRNLCRMNRCLMLVRNMIRNSGAPEDVLECLESVDESMREALRILDNREI